MASYDPRVYQLHASGVNHNILNVTQRYPHHGNSSLTNIHQGSTSGPHHGQSSVLTQEKAKTVSGWLQTYRTAQNIAFPDPRTVCGEKVGAFLEDLARAIGCPVEYVLVPLLPCVGGLLGTNTSVRVHRGWSESPIVWTIVGANPGTRRSAVIRQLLAPILAIQSNWSQGSSAASNLKAKRPEGLGAVNGVSNQIWEDGEGSRSPEEGSSKSKIAHNETKHDCHLRALYSGTRITAAALTEVLHRNDGHAFSLTENVENLHEMLGLLQPVISPRLVSVMEDLYEGLPLVAVEDGKVTTIQGSNFSHGGFASPEYAVTLMLKCPSWLSARLLLSCPQADDMKGVFGEAVPDSDVPELEFVYDILLRQHMEKRTYTYDPEAIQELGRFFDDEWSSVLNQLDQNEHEGIIGKSMGQIVRLSGILKAFENGITAANAESYSENTPEWDWIIGVSTVKCAITLGKYFLEEKLAMTFMIGSSFFSSAQENSCNGNANEILQSSTLPQTAVSQDTVREGYFSTSHNQLSESNLSSHISSTSNISIRPQRPMSQDSLPSTSQGSLSQNEKLPQPFPSLFELPKQLDHATDVDYSTLPQTMTTLEEDVSEMMMSVDFVHFSKTQFVAVHGRRIKRLLECYDDGHGVSATTAAQKSITPPVRIEGTNNRHPAWASALFFQKVAELNLGTAEQGRHPTNRKVCWRFKRKPVNQLSEKDFHLLQYLRVEMEKYSQFGSVSFNPTMMVNCGLISLSASNSPSPASHMQASPLPTGLDDDSNSQSTSPVNSSSQNIKSEVF